MATPDARHITDAVIVMLADAVGRPVGDHQAPGDDKTPPSLPYLVVESEPGGTMAGSVSNRHDSRLFLFTLTAVGERRDQAQALAQRAVNAVVDRDPVHRGWRCPLDPVDDSNQPAARIVDRRHEASGGVDREGPLFNAVETVAVVASVAGI